MLYQSNLQNLDNILSQDTQNKSGDKTKQMPEQTEQTILDIITKNGKIVSEEEELIIGIIGTLKTADLISLFSSKLVI